MKLPALKLPRLLPILAVVAVTTLQFGTPRPAHADTYSVTGELFWEAQQGFQGIDSSGNVYLDNFNTGVYSTLFDGNLIGTSNVVPNFISDRGGSCTTAVPGVTQYLDDEICNGSRVAYIVFPNGNSGAGALYMYSGTGAPQLAAAAPFGDILAMNGLGDIIFDNGFIDFAYEAVDLTKSPPPTPEPSTLLLLTTGILALGLTARHRLAH
jgi:hypothetical protein